MISKGFGDHGGFFVLFTPVASVCNHFCPVLSPSPPIRRPEHSKHEDNPLERCKVSKGCFYRLISRGIPPLRRLSSALKPIRWHSMESAMVVRVKLGESLVWMVRLIALRNWTKSGCLSIADRTLPLRIQKHIAITSGQMHFLRVLYKKSADLRM